MIHTIMLWSAIVSGVFQTYFIVRYALGRWWPHYVGRALFFKSLALAFMLDLDVFSYFVDYSFEPELQAFAHSALAVAVIWQVLALEHARRDEHPHRKGQKRRKLFIPTD